MEAPSPVEQRPEERHRCPFVVLDPAPPLRIRPNADGSGSPIGTLANGSLVQVLERQGFYVRIAQPTPGWVHRNMLYDTCRAPGAVPALPLGERTYLLLPFTASDAPIPSAGTPLGAPPIDPVFLEMDFSWRDAHGLEVPVPVTLVTKTGACLRTATRRVTLVGICRPGVDDYSTYFTALEVESCPELTLPTLDRPHVATPLMVGVFGNHAGALLEDWPYEERAATSAQQAVLATMIEGFSEGVPDEYRAEQTPEVPGAFRHFENSPWSWVDLNENHLLFHGDTYLDQLDWVAGRPMRVRVGNRLLVVVGNSGFHGDGFYMFPNARRRGQIRISGYPTFSCAPN